MENETQTPHKRRVRYKGKYPKKFEEKYKELQPDIVTMDITMPEMDGLEALREIKKIDPGASVVMVSALGQEARMKEAIIYGAKGFIVKPFKEEMLISALSKL